MGMRVKGTLALLALVVGCGAGVAYATGTIGSGGGGIVACAKNQNGQLRVVDQPSDCLPSEHVVLLGAPSAGGGASVVVDCAAGQTITQALADNESASSLDIGVKGVCTESVRIARDHVYLHGASPGAGIAGPASDAPVLTVDGGRWIGLDTLALTGGRWGLTVLNGGSVNASNLTFSGGGDQDVTVGGGGSLYLRNASIAGGGEGVSAQSGGSVSVDGGTIAGTSSFAVHAHDGGSIQLGGGVVVSGAGFHAVVAQDAGSVLLQTATVRDNAGTGVFAFQGGSVFVTRDATVEGNHQGGVGANAGTAEVDGHVTGNSPQGVFSYNGGVLTIQDGALVDHNASDGVQVSTGGTLAVQRAAIEDNGGAGISLNGTASASFGDGNTITGNGWAAIGCETGPPAVAQINVGPGGIGIVSGAIDCPRS